ncbi:unnamed protein product [Effrenium voratum]|nr:unnamed protein product [Effrenium voratum]
MEPGTKSCKVVHVNERLRVEEVDNLKLTVSLPSGRAEAISLPRAATVGDLKLAAQKALQRRFLRLAGPDGNLLDTSTSLQEAKLKDGDSITAAAQQAYLTASRDAFALWCSGNTAGRPALEPLVAQLPELLPSFGLPGTDFTWKELPSFDDRNLLVSVEGRKYVLKAHNTLLPSGSHGRLQAQDRLIQHLQKQALPVPDVLENLGAPSHVRVLSYLEGEVLKRLSVAGEATAPFRSWALSTGRPTKPT